MAKIERKRVGRWAAWLVLALLLALSGPVGAQGPSLTWLPGTVAVEDAVLAAVEGALVAGTGTLPASPYYAITALRSEDGWRFVSVAGLGATNERFPRGWSLDDATWLGVVLARQDAAGAWTGAVEGTAAYSALLAEVPGDILSAAQRADLDPLARPPTPPELFTYRFPWQPGTWMMYGILGVHNNGFASVVPNWRAVDFESDGDTGAGHAPNAVLAAHTGTITYLCDDGLSVAFRINNDIFYTHLLLNSGLYTGSTFAQGQWMGQLKTGPFSDNCGWADQAANWFHLHWGFPDAGTFIAEDWVLDLATGLWHRGGETRGILDWFEAGQYADLRISKRVDNAVPPLGGNVTFTLTLHNNGPLNATGIAVTDPLPAGLSYVTHGGGTYNPSSGLWSVGAVASGASATLTITATVTSSATLTNTAAITASAQYDPNAANNQASAVVNPQYFTAGSYEETDARLLYNSQWKFKAKAAASSGTAAKAKAGAVVEFWFAGDVLVITRRTGPDDGDMDVCIDGTCALVNNTSALVAWQEPVAFGPFADGIHAVTISRPADQAAFWFDGMTVVDLNTPLAAGVLHQEDAAGLLYVNDWAVKVKAAANGGAAMKARSGDSAVFFNFTGDQFTLYRRIGPGEGVMRVCIDGVCITQSNESPVKVWGVPVLFDGLGAGAHTVGVYRVPGSRLFFDALWIGSGAPLPPQESPGVPREAMGESHTPQDAPPAGENGPRTTTGALR
ncbi:MAG: DUF11 domain-containing protein [Anaerolineae bacterium]|nr:DUF11 domain-containing protein [Anaerolineae bacterium]